MLLDLERLTVADRPPLGLWYTAFVPDLDPSRVDNSTTMATSAEIVTTTAFTTRVNMSPFLPDVLRGGREASCRR